MDVERDSSTACWRSEEEWVRGKRTGWGSIVSVKEINSAQVCYELCSLVI